MAEQVGDLIDVIVGGHSHTLLWPKDNNKYPNAKEIVDEYPKVIQPKIAPDRKVLVLQAFCHGKVVGGLKVDFNHEGEVEKWESSPLYLDQNYPKDPEAEKTLGVWRKEVAKISKGKVGETKVLLQGKNCRWDECTLGNFIARVFRKVYAKDFPDLPILALVQAGSFKGDIAPGGKYAFLPCGDKIPTN